MRHPAAVLFVLAALLAASQSNAQDRTQEMEQLFAFATAETPGCAVGVSQNGKVVVDTAYGLADVERKIPLTQRSRFDIGSTQKQFTAASILLLAADGRLSLSDDIRKFLPELPDYGHRVTVDQLLTHTAGIRDWTGLLPLAPEGTEVLQLILRQRGLNTVPGEEWAYSNSGFELAKEIVARVSGMSFADFTRRRLFEPLGMTATVYAPDILQAGENTAVAYRKTGSSWTPFMRLGNDRGGGAIVSTVGDLLIWNDALATGKLGAFVNEKLHENARLANGREVRYARGLFVDAAPEGPVISHSGGAAGFSTWMGRFPDHGLAVAIACNFDGGSSGVRERVADLFLPPVNPEALQRWRAGRPVPVQGVDVSSRAGLYFDEHSGEPLRLEANGPRLAVVNGPQLVPVSAERFRPPMPQLFFRSQDDFELSFRDADHFEIRSMEGGITRYRRAQPWTPAPADLQPVDGRYESAELGTVVDIVAGNGGISMRMTNAPERATPFTPVAPDVYMFRMMTLRFHRDASADVIGFEYSNPVAKGVAFTRVGER